MSTFSRPRLINMTPRKTLDQNKIHPTISPSVEQYHSDIVNQVINAVEENEAVVIGMALNPSVKRARKLLEKQGLKVTYLEFGGYGSMCASVWLLKCGAAGQLTHKSLLKAH